MLVPTEPVHHAGPILAVVREEDGPVQADDHEEDSPVQANDRDEDGPVLADVRDKGDGDEGDEEDSQICAGKAQSSSFPSPSVGKSGKTTEVLFLGWKNAGRSCAENCVQSSQLCTDLPVCSVFMLHAHSVQNYRPDKRS